MNKEISKVYTEMIFYQVKDHCDLLTS